MIWLVVELILQVNKNYFAGGPSVHKNEEIVEQKPPHFQKALDVSFPCFILDTRECDIFDILECHAFQKYSTCWVLGLYLCICVFVYLCVSHLIHGNVIFDFLESHAFEKCSTCWVFSL